MPDATLTALQRLGYIGQQAQWALTLLAKRGAGVPLSWAERDAIERMIQAAMVVYFDYQAQRLAQMLLSGIEPDWALEAKMGERFLEPGLLAGYQVGVTVAGLEVGGIGVDWTLVNENAVTWAREHTAEVLRTISKTTADRYGQTADRIAGQIGDFIESGQPLPKLIAELSQDMPANRAEMVAVTETTRAFAKSNMEVWQEADYWGSMWRTAMDERVCKVCGTEYGLEGQVAKLGETFKLKDGSDSGLLEPPAHVLCRCGTTPVLDAPVEVADAR